MCGGKTSSGSLVMGKIPLQNNTHEHLKTLGLFSAVSSNMCNSLSSGTLQKKKKKSKAFKFTADRSERGQSCAI